MQTVFHWLRYSFLTTNAYIYKEIGRLAYLIGVNERLFSILYPEVLF